jgi:hypothetical protein
MDNIRDFSSGRFLFESDGIVSWCILKMQINASNGLSPSAVTQVFFDVRRNMCTKKFCILPDSIKQYKKNVDTGRRPNNGNQAFFHLNFL